MADPSLTPRNALAADPVRNYRFVVSFYPQIMKTDGGLYGSTAWKPVGRFGFTSVSGFAFNVAVQQIREGGYNATVRQVPTNIEFSALQLDRGIVLGSQQNWDWMKMLLRTVQGRASNAKALFRSDVEIAVLNAPVPYANRKGGKGYSTGASSESAAARDDSVAMRFRIYNAWPTSVVYSDLNAGDNALMVERMTLVHEGLDLLWGKESNGRITSAGNFGTPTT